MFQKQRRRRKEQPLSRKKQRRQHRRSHGQWSQHTQLGASTVIYLPAITKVRWEGNGLGDTQVLLIMNRRLNITLTTEPARSLRLLELHSRTMRLVISSGCWDIWKSVVGENPFRGGAASFRISHQQGVFCLGIYLIFYLTHSL